MRKSRNAREKKIEKRERMKRYEEAKAIRMENGNIVKQCEDLVAEYSKAIIGYTELIANEDKLKDTKLVDPETKEPVEDISKKKEIIKNIISKFESVINQHKEYINTTRCSFYYVADEIVSKKDEIVEVLNNGTVTEGAWLDSFNRSDVETAAIFQLKEPVTNAMENVVSIIADTYKSTIEEVTKVFDAIATVVTDKNLYKLYEIYPAAMEAKYNNGSYIFIDDESKVIFDNKTQTVFETVESILKETKK